MIIWVIFLCFFNLEYIGKKADVSAPSAVILLNKFGNLNAIINISEKIPAPRNAATNISLIKPEIRLTNVKKADSIIMMHQGVIDEVGTHEELIDKKGWYYALYRQQGDN